MTPLRKQFVLTVLLLCSVFANAQTNTTYSNLELDSLLQSKKWLCGLPVGFATLFDSLNKERVLIPKGTEGIEYYVVSFSKKDFKCEIQTILHCTFDAYNAALGFYNLNEDGTITVQIKWNECSGEWCNGEPGRTSCDVAAITYRVKVQDENIIFKLIE